MKLAVVALFICFVALSSASAQFYLVRAALPKVWVSGKIRIFYDVQGEHAVDATDVNMNGVPDQVEDIGTQTLAAQMLFIDVLGFPDPFKEERFKSVHFLDIHLLNKATLKSNGLTYDEIQTFRRTADPKGTRSICFDVATSIKAPENLTPAHEFFHIIQNGATYFKNAWFTEGTARWSEKALGTGGASEGMRFKWPLSEKNLSSVDSMKYDASPRYWEPFALSMDLQGDIPESRVPAALREMKYTDDSPVLKDLKLHGWEAIRDVIIELGKLDDEAAKDRNLPKWPEAQQKSPLNTPYILRAVEQVQKARAN